MNPRSTHEDLAADLEHRRRSPLQLERNRLYGPDIVADVFPGEPVAPRCPSDEYAVLVAQTDRCTVEFGFGLVVDRLFLAQSVTDTPVEFIQLLVAESIVQGEHGNVVRNGPEFRDRRCPHPLGRRISRYQVRVIGLQGLKLPKKPIVFGVRHLGIVKNVVAVIVMAQGRPEFVDLAFELRRTHLRP